MTTIPQATTSLRRRTVLATALAAIGCPAAAQGYDELVDLDVIDRDTGRPLPVWRRDGRRFVAGAPGARYGLRVTNRTDGRVLVVMSVDGVNVLTGQTAGYGQRGYVFGPWQSYDVGGWRKSDTEVAAFTFAALSRSYAARTGRPGDVGVIGIAAFRERAIPPPVAVGPAYEPQSRAGAADTVEESVVTGARRAPSYAPRPVAPTERRMEEKLGTAHGAREWSSVTTVAFERATAYPQLIRRIEYDTWDNLVALGVIRQPPPPRRPRPFPSESGAGYVPDPPAWR